MYSMTHAPWCILRVGRWYGEFEPLALYAHGVRVPLGAAQGTLHSTPIRCALTSIPALGRRTYIRLCRRVLFCRVARSGVS